MTGFQGDSEQFFQLIQQYRIVIPRARARARSAARGIAGRAGRGVPTWAPSNMSNSTRNFNPESEVGTYNVRTDTFTPVSAGTANALSWVGRTSNGTLLTTKGNLTIGSTTIDNASYRTISSTSQSINDGSYSKTGENIFHAFCTSLRVFSSKGLLKVGSSLNGYELSFNSEFKPVVTFKNSTADSNEFVATGTFAATAAQFQVHVIQRVGNSLIWSIDGNKCIDVKTSYLGGSGVAIPSLFKGFSGSTVPSYELLEYFRSDATATTEIDRIKAEGYLAHKYSIDLPRGHRYKKSAPGA